jgi:hypothetical protein
MKEFLRFAVATAASAAALHANASLSFSESAAPAGGYSAPAFTTSRSDLAYSASESIIGVQLAPAGSTGTFLTVTTGGSATVALGGVSSYSFLWGSPDLYNTLMITTSLGTQTYSGGHLLADFGISPNGDNASSFIFTITGIGEVLESLRFVSTGVAFEVANPTPVAEPETYSLLLAGLLVVGFLGRRIHKDDVSR